MIAGRSLSSHHLGSGFRAATKEPTTGCDFNAPSSLLSLHTGAFSPGVPTLFLSNYRAAMHFLGQLEGMCTTRAAFQVTHTLDFEVVQLVS